MTSKTVKLTGARDGGVVVEILEGYETKQAIAFERRAEADEQYAARITDGITSEIYLVVMERLKQIRQKEAEARNE
jgi:hypothetical protein